MDLRNRFPPVVVGVDASGPASAAAVAAAEEARRRLLPLRLVRALPGPENRADGRWPTPVRLGPRHAAVAELTALRRALLHHLPNGPVSAAVTTGPPVRVLLQEATCAELLVVGASGADHPVPHVGAVTRTVAQRSPCPVLVVPASAPASAAAPVLVVVDGGPGTRRLLSVAVLQAATRSTGLDVVPVHVPGGDGPGASTDLTAEVERLVEGHPGVPVHLHDPVPATVTALTAAARGAAVLVVGRGEQEEHRGLPALRGLLAAACTSILVVPLSRAPAPVSAPVRALAVEGVRP